MKIKVIKIKEFKIGDKVEFTQEVKDFWLKMSKDKHQIKISGIELLEEMVIKHNKIHIVEFITKNMGNGKPLIWLEDLIGSNMITRLIKI